MATQEPVYDDYEGRSDEIDLDLTSSILVSMEHQYMCNEAMRHRHPNYERGSDSGIQMLTRGNQLPLLN